MNRFLSSPFSVRVRFAPSPTGQLHLGSLRTALYNYLFATKNAGSLVLRIQDTDQARNKSQTIPELMGSLKWCGIQWQEGPDVGGNKGPYLQSQRKDLYKKYISQLIGQGHVFKCVCQLDSKVCRCQQKNLIPTLQSHLKVRPTKNQGSFKDEVFGQRKSNFGIKAFSITKQDGSPLFLLANTLDDYLMEISHVIRGQQFLQTTHKQIHLYDLLKIQKPKFAHLPLLADSQSSKKLSKRKQHSSVNFYKERGICASALVNYVGFLGFTPFDQVRSIKQQMKSLKDLSQIFDLSLISRSPIKIDISKLQSFNKQYWLRMLSHKSTRSEQVKRFSVMLQQAFPDQTNISNYSNQKLILIRSCAERYPFRLDKLSWIFVKPSVVSSPHQSLLFKIFQTLPQDFTQKQLGQQCIQWSRVRGDVSEGTLLGQLRQVLTGNKQGPSGLAVARILGRDECLRRLNESNQQQ